jgi:hypothetical protein
MINIETGQQILAASISRDIAPDPIAKEKFCAANQKWRRRSRLWGSLSAGFIFLVSAPAAGADQRAVAAMKQCDSLAASPNDANREGAGVVLSEIDHAAAWQAAAKH